MSLDGFIADPEENLEWLNGFDGPGYAGDAPPVESSYEEFIAGVGALAMGSKTYEFLIPHDWMYGDMPVWVLTTRRLPEISGATGVRFADSPVAELHDEMIRTAGGKDLWVVGGGNVAAQFVAVRLLDELRVTVVPIALGAGLPLFAGTVPPMRLTGLRPFSNGMAELTYELAGSTA